MLLATGEVDPVSANDDEPLPGDVFVGSVDYDDGIFPRGTVVAITVLSPGDIPESGTLSIFDDGTDIVVGRLMMVGDWWTVDEAASPIRRRLLRDRWTLRASVQVELSGGR